jgi:putative peptide maturation system protein
MSDQMPQAIADALAFLSSITADELRPPEAQERLRALQARHLGVELELVWEEESFDHSFHYDLLVRPEGGDTVSMSVARERALPWPLRGVRRFTEANLVQVNGRMLTMERAVGFLDVLWNEAPIHERMIDSCLVREELERHPVDLSDDELQEGLDALRRTHRLYSAEATEAWMAERGLDHERLERLVIDNVTGKKLRRRVAEGKVAGFFEHRQAELDCAQVLRLELGDETRARRLVPRLRGGELELHAAAEAELVATSEPARLEFTTLRRGVARDPLGAAVFAAHVGDFVGPIREGRSFVVARVLGFRSALADDATRAAIEQILFDEWLAERRSRATVTWHWGHEPAGATR